MDALSLLRMLGALLLVLGGMVCALWAVKRYDLTIPRKWLEGLGQKSPEKNASKWWSGWPSTSAGRSSCCAATIPNSASSSAPMA
ncbi:hypothetical protein ACFSTD_03690 [Novosphingobium colocasiae]